MIKRLLWSATALGLGLSCWVPFLYLALSRKTGTDKRDAAVWGGVSILVFVAMLLVRDRLDGVSAIVGFTMCATAVGAAVHAFVSLARPNTKDDAVNVTVTSGRAYL
ncbi:hypothetical protein NJL88_28945 [Streptomyces sp. DK15]|uniref:hypothetical protein n=1 Tax=Streptomyces sp. DK15 TaxID=2957499 RepID=UPI0029B375BD|nr:hypothetical protein [Streptomyces sp. DK15]MDX2394021.1 hypothetical protein [Streptomyces sp. DK15]